MVSSHLVIFSTSGKFITKFNVSHYCISLSETLFWIGARGRIPITLTLSMPGGRGGAESLRFFLHNSKTPGDIKKKLSDFSFTPLTVILHILSITIVIRCCHSKLLFSVCHLIFGIEKQRNLNYFQDNYLIKLKFG